MRLNEHRNTSDDYDRARDLRNNASPVERKLWCVLRENMVQRGLKFRRQHSIHPYIADFVCLEARLLVELDGDSHDARQRYDAARDAYLRGKGFVVLRFSNAEVMDNVEGVAGTILNYAEQLVRTLKDGAKPRSPLPVPPHKGEGTLPHHRSQTITDEEL